MTYLMGTREYFDIPEDNADLDALFATPPQVAELPKSCQDRGEGTEMQVWHLNDCTYWEVVGAAENAGGFWSKGTISPSVLAGEYVDSCIAGRKKISVDANDYDDATWYGTVVNDINNRIVTFLTENFDLPEEEIRDIAQELVERITIVDS